MLGPDGKTLAEDDGYDANAFALYQQDAQIAAFKIPADGIYTADITENSSNAGSFVLTITIKR